MWFPSIQAVPLRTLSVFVCNKADAWDGLGKGEIAQFG